jgi:hypothetical protein
VRRPGKPTLVVPPHTSLPSAAGYWTDRPRWPLREDPLEDIKGGHELE